MISWWYRASTLSPLFFCSFPFFNIRYFQLQSRQLDYRFFRVSLEVLLYSYRFANKFFKSDMRFLFLPPDLKTNIQIKREEKKNDNTWSIERRDRVRISSSAVIEKSSIIESLIENWMFWETKERFYPVKLGKNR